MKAVDRLRRDHRTLRSKLDVIDAALRMGPEARSVLREICATLSRQLHNHMKREEDLVVRCRKALNPKVLAEVALAHRDEPEHLQALQRLFTGEGDRTLERIAPAFAEVSQGLRRHMAEEERELFPLLERELAAQEPPRPAETREPLSECMTVNRVVHDWPATKAVFERLLINPKFDGCTCLDEVAWQHGMEARELLDQLERAMPPGQRRAKEAEPETATCGCR